jgi:hypothetical protein
MSKSQLEATTLLLALASVVILGSEFQRTHEHNLLPDCSDDPYADPRPYKRVQENSWRNSMSRDITSCKVTLAESYPRGPLGVGGSLASPHRSIKLVN